MSLQANIIGATIAYSKTAKQCSVLKVMFEHCNYDYNIEVLKVWAQRYCKYSSSGVVERKDFTEERSYEQREERLSFD